MRTLLLVLFSVCWAAVAFAVIRAVVIAWGYHRPFATATAFAVAAAFALGATAPFSLVKRFAGPAEPTVAAAVPHLAACPTNAKIAKAVGQGHIDALLAGGAQVDKTKTVEVSRGDDVRVNGWVVSASGPAAGLCVIVDGHAVAFQGQYGLDRPDVANAVGKPEDRGAGFDLSVHVSPGTHVLTVGPVQADGSVTPLTDTVRLHVQ